MATKEALEKLRSERSRLEAHPALTPQNAAFGYLRYQLDIQREQDIRAGELAQKRLQIDKPKNVTEYFRSDYNSASSQGFAKAQFNQSQTKQQEIKL